MMVLTIEQSITKPKVSYYSLVSNVVYDQLPKGSLCYKCKWMGNDTML
jgi:hypothetical protein